MWLVFDCCSVDWLLLWIESSTSARRFLGDNSSELNSGAIIRFLAFGFPVRLGIAFGICFRISFDTVRPSTDAFTSCRSFVFWIHFRFGGDFFNWSLTNLTVGWLLITRRPSASVIIFWTLFCNQIYAWTFMNTHCEGNHLLSLSYSACVVSSFQINTITLKAIFSNTKISRKPEDYFFWNWILHVIFATMTQQLNIMSIAPSFLVFIPHNLTFNQPT